MNKHRQARFPGYWIYYLKTFTIGEVVRCFTFIKEDEGRRSWK